VVVGEHSGHSLRICFDLRACPHPSRRKAMAAPSVDDLARSFERYLRAGRRSPRTIETYLETLGGFAA
jgi:hypothetical protein